MAKVIMMHRTAILAATKTMGNVKPAEKAKRLKDVNSFNAGIHITDESNIENSYSILDLMKIEIDLSQLSLEEVEELSLLIK